MNTLDPLFALASLEIAGQRCLPFALSAGEILMVSGPSGCGKTRLLRAIADLDLNNARVSVSGRCREDLTGPQWRQRVMMVPGESAWWADSVAPHFSTLPDASMLAALNLPLSILDMEVARLSSGERQRLGLLRSLLRLPQVVLLDEPTANLDECNVAAMEGFILDWLERHAACALWVSHDPAQRRRIPARQLSFEQPVWSLG